jgi:thiamine transport system permease protein
MDQGMANSNSKKLIAWQPAQPIIAWLCIFGVAVIAIGPFILGILAAVRLDPTADTGIDHDALWDAFRFTMAQAGLSAAIVSLFAPIFGLCFFYCTPRYRHYAGTLRSLLFCLPSVVIATGIVLCWGKEGFMTSLFNSSSQLSFTNTWLYSKYSIVTANVFMNLPFATLTMSRALASIGNDKIISSRLLGLNHLSNFRLLFWPAIRGQFFYMFGLIFLLCMGSFGALSIFSGSHGFTTLELGIYQSLFLNSNWPMGAAYAILHTVCSALVSLTVLAPQYVRQSKSLSVVEDQIDYDRIKDLLPASKMFCWAALGLSIIFDVIFASPIFATWYDAFKDIGRLLDPESSIFRVLNRSLAQSITYALPSAVLATAMGWIIARAHTLFGFLRRPVHASLILLGVFALNIIPGMAGAFGFIALKAWVPHIPWSTWPVILLHTTAMLPFLVMHALHIYQQTVGRHLGTKYLTGMSRFGWLYRVELPLMKKALLTMFIVGFSLSVNETAVVSMLGDPESPTLTTTMIGLMGHYRFSDSAIVASILIMLTFISLLIYAKPGGLNHGDT